jgi:(p)ppGpp synthase/HD superfamily hydrolase
MFCKAILFATNAHNGQFRKGSGLPYIIHPMTVAVYMNTYDAKVSEDLLAAALLHDVVEDCDVTLETIETEFNKKIRDLVEELTSDKKEIERVGKTVYLTEKMIKMSEDALTIKLCDRLSNMRDSVSLPEDKIAIYTKSTSEILEALGNARYLSQKNADIVSDIWKEIYRPIPM